MAKAIKDVTDIPSFIWFWKQICLNEDVNLLEKNVTALRQMYTGYYRPAKESTLK
jgi:hypothetical protein